jgi:hypothetical protein
VGRSGVSGGESGIIAAISPVRAALRVEEGVTGGGLKYDSNNNIYNLTLQNVSSQISLWLLDRVWLPAILPRYFVQQVFAGGSDQFQSRWARCHRRMAV